MIGITSLVQFHIISCVASGVAGCLDMTEVIPKWLMLHDLYKNGGG